MARYRHRQALDGRAAADAIAAEPGRTSPPPRWYGARRRAPASAPVRRTPGVAPTADSSPSAPRTATSSPSRPMSMSGARSVGASAAPTGNERDTGEPPARLPQHQPQPAGDHQDERQRRHGRNAAAPRPAPRRRDGRPHHRVDAAPHDPERQRLEPERHGDERRQRRRHDDQVADRQGDEIGDHRVLLAVVEVIGGERRHRGAGDERRQHDAGEEEQRGAQMPAASALPARALGAAPRRRR